MSALRRFVLSRVKFLGETDILSRVKFLGETNIALDHCRNCGGFWLDGGELNLIDRELEKIMPVSGHGFSDFVNNVHLPFWYKRVRRPSSETDFKVAVQPIRGAKHKGATDRKCPCRRCDTRSLHAGAHKIRRLSEMSRHVARQGRTQKAQEHGQRWPVTLAEPGGRQYREDQRDHVFTTLSQMFFKQVALGHLWPLGRGH